MRTFLLVAAAALGLLLASPALAANGPKDNDTHVQLLAINDFHGNLQANTPGKLTYCCELDTNPTVSKEVPVSRNLGGIQYLATLVKQLRDRNSNTITVGAGDMIGASPLISGLFHDEPAVEALNALGLQVTGVGNHEFDEGINELYRMQYGGCVASDPTTCAGGPFTGALYRYLAANVFFEGTNNTVFPPYKIIKVDNAKIAFIGLTLEGTPLIVTPTAVQGLEFRPEVQTVNALVDQLRNEEGVRTFVVLLHQGGFQNGPFSNKGKYGAPFANGFADINACDNLSDAIVPIVKQLDKRVDVVVSAHTHAAYNCPNFAGTGILLTSASSFGRVVTSIDLTIDHQTKDVTAVTATNYPVKQTTGPFNSAVPGDLGAPVAKDATETQILDKWEALAGPIQNRIIGHITADLTNAGGTTGESQLGDVIADAQLASTAPTDFGGAVVAFMNSGGIRANLVYAPVSGETRAAGEVTYGNAFAVQPFANVMQVKTLTGQQIYDVLEQQWSGANSAQTKILQVSNGFTYSYDMTRAPTDRVIPGTVKIGGTAVDPFASYRVAMNNFIGGGGDGFSVFASGTNTLGGMVDIDAFANYLTAHDPLPMPTVDRITRIH